MVSPDWAAPHPPDLPPVRRREVFAWALFDFANSGYTTVVITAVFNAWFVAGIAGGASWATLAWTAALSLSYALNLLSSPLLGAWADLRAQKRGLLLASTALCVAALTAIGIACSAFTPAPALAATAALLIGEALSLIDAGVRIAAGGGGWPSYLALHTHLAPAMRGHSAGYRCSAHPVYWSKAWVSPSEIQPSARWNESCRARSACMSS